MNVLCPNCQQKLSVSEENAGQLMKCPACSRYFSVPALPQTAAVAAGPGAAPNFPSAPSSTNVGASSPPPAQPDVFTLAPEPAAPQPLPTRQMESAASRSTSQPRPQATPEISLPPPPGSYDQTFTIWISPRVVRWIAPVALLLVLLFMFFPWTGVYPGGYGIYTQNAFQMIWGGFSIDPVGDKVVGMAKAIHGAIWANWLMIFYFLLIVVALLLAAAPNLLALIAYPVPPAFQRFWPWRNVLAVIALLLAFLILLSFLVSGSGFENAVTVTAEGNAGKEPTKPASEEQLEQTRIKRAMELDRLNLSRTAWLHCAVWLHLLALAGASLELWLERRGARPLPRLEVYW